jgi:hypothetical protein
VVALRLVEHRTVEICEWGLSWIEVGAISTLSSSPHCPAASQLLQAFSFVLLWARGGSSSVIAMTVNTNVGHLRGSGQGKKLRDGDSGMTV